MKRIFGLLSVIALLFTACQKDEVGMVQQDEPLAVNGQIIPGRYIVVLKNDGPQKVSSNGTYAQKQKEVLSYSQEIMSNLQLPKESVKATYSGVITGFVTELAEWQVAKLQGDKRIAFVEPDRVITLGVDAKGKPTGGTTSPSQTTPWGISRIGGFVSYSGTGTAWIIDTGIDLDHADLNVDVARSRTFVDRTKNADDENGHGTHVAGTVAALNNTIGVVGVAAGAPVVAVRVLDRRGSGSYSWIIAGVDYVGANAKSGDVVNMSLGGPSSDALDQAVLNAAAKGIKFAIAAGNESQNSNNVSPARVNHQNVYTISAMDSKDVFASFSNYANPPVDYCAPGVNIYSTYKGGGYSTLSGTSMASPHACGVLLLGAPRTDGYVLNDPDGNADPIIHR